MQGQVPIVLLTAGETRKLQRHLIGDRVSWCDGAILLKGWICLLVELHWEGYAPAACAAGLFSVF